MQEQQKTFDYFLFFMSEHKAFIGNYWKLEACINLTKGLVFYLQWGKEPRHTALLSIVTRNMWQFLKSDSILSMDSILKAKDKHKI